MASTYIFLASFLVAYVAAMPSLESGNLGSFSGCPPNNPFCPIWVPCNFTINQGPYCQDCSTRVICTPVGGLVLPCPFPGIANCVDGECSAEPSEECSPTTEGAESDATDDVTEGSAEDTEPSGVNVVEYAEIRSKDEVSVHY